MCVFVKTICRISQFICLLENIKTMKKRKRSEIDGQKVVKYLFSKTMRENIFFGRHMEVIEDELRKSGKLADPNLKTWTLEGDTAEAWFAPRFIFSDPTNFGGTTPICPEHCENMRPPIKQPWDLRTSRLLLDRYWPVVLVTKRVRCPKKKCNRNLLLTSNSYLSSQNSLVLDRFHTEFGRLTKRYGFTPQFWRDISRNRNRNSNAKSFYREWTEGLASEYWSRARIVEAYQWESSCPDFNIGISHQDLFKRVEEVAVIEEMPFWLAKRCKQVGDVKLNIKNNPRKVIFSIDDTFDLATRIKVLLDNQQNKIYKQVQSIMYLGKTLVNLRFTATGAEILRKDTIVWIQKELLGREIPSNEEENVGHVIVNTDDCCKHRKFYLKIQGSGLKLKLDWMHGIHRILKHISFMRYQGNHKELSEIRDKLRFCGFPPGARVRSGEELTLEGKTIFINLSNWIKAVPASLRTDTLIRAVENLKTHSECLSNQSARPCERGTNSNEGFHRHSRKALPKIMSPVIAEHLVTRFIAEFNPTSDGFPTSFQEWITKSNRKPSTIYVPTDKDVGRLPSIFGDGLSQVFREMKAPVVNGLDLSLVKSDLFKHASVLTAVQACVKRRMRRKDCKEPTQITQTISQHLSNTMAAFSKLKHNDF